MLYFSLVCATSVHAAAFHSLKVSRILSWLRVREWIILFSPWQNCIMVPSAGSAQLSARARRSKVTM